MLLNSHKILTTGNRPRPRVRLATGVYACDELSCLGRQLGGYHNRCPLFWRVECQYWNSLESMRRAHLYRRIDQMDRFARKCAVISDAIPLARCDRVGGIHNASLPSLKLTLYGLWSDWIALFEVNGKLKPTSIKKLVELEQNGN